LTCAQLAARATLPTLTMTSTSSLTSSHIDDASSVLFPSETHALNWVDDASSLITQSESHTNLPHLVLPTHRPRITSSPLWVMNSSPSQATLQFMPPHQPSTYSFRLKQSFKVRGYKDPNGREHESAISEMDRERGILCFRLQKGPDDNKEVIWLTGTTRYTYECALIRLIRTYFTKFNVLIFVYVVYMFLFQRLI
jgi:hypothetical protein